MPATSAVSKKVAKPYDRPSTSSKGKEKALPSSIAAREGVNIGAPSQHGQKSRKGKKAWRKNVDITGVETALEHAREEERITG